MSERTTDVVPESAARALASMDQARAAIATAVEMRDADALTGWRDMAVAAQHYASRREDAAALAADAGEIKLRAEAALGKLDSEAHPFGGSSPREDPPLVASRHMAAWRKLGVLMDAGHLDIVMERLRADDLRGVTTVAAVRLVPEYLPSAPRERRPRMGEAERLRERRREFDDLLVGIEREARTAIARFAEIEYDGALMPTRDRLHRLVGEAISHLQTVNEWMEGRS